MDNLLSQGQDCGDKDCPALARVLLASLAACNHSTFAQTVLVTEIKGALQRALVLPESVEKHSKIQAFTGIISTVIESCPSPGQIPNQVFKGQQNCMNNMVKILLKRGLVTDLARIPHNLDLSSPSMANTVNAALKPLETLSRIVNQPQTVLSKSKPKINSTVPGILSSGIVDEAAADNTQVVTAQVEPNVANEGNNVRDLHIEDVTATPEEHEGLEETEALEAVEPEMDSQDTHVCTH